VLAVVGGLSEIFDFLSGLPGCLDDQDPPTFEDVLTFCFCAVMRHNARLARIDKAIGAIDPSFGVDHDQTLMVRFGDGRYLGLYALPGLPTEPRPSFYISGSVGQPGAIETWDLDPEGWSADLRGIPLGDRWKDAADAAANPCAWFVGLVRRLSKLAA